MSDTYWCEHCGKQVAAVVLMRFQKDWDYFVYEFMCPRCETRGSTNGWSRAYDYKEAYSRYKSRLLESRRWIRHCQRVQNRLPLEDRDSINRMLSGCISEYERLVALFGVHKWKVPYPAWQPQSKEGMTQT